MPEIEIFEDKSILVGKRRKGRDESIQDALRTIERLSDWLTLAQETNAWRQADALTTAMLYGLLAHVRDEIERVLALGGDEARDTFEFFRATTPARGSQRQNDN
jgi:hypothetical protein